VVVTQLRSVVLLQQADKMELAELSDLVHLRINELADAVSNEELAPKLRNTGPAAARQLWEFLDRLPERAPANGHFHFATGLKEPSMAPPGSTAHDLAVRWSKTLSEAIDLVGYDFAATPTGDARATHDRLGKLLSDENDRFITARLRFFDRE
jgi:hypothetical protein